MKIGLALSSGGARGWAQLGALAAMEEIGFEADVVAGSSVGALIGGALLTGRLADFADWARALSPLNAANFFSIAFARGGVVRTDRAFEAFAEADCLIEELPKPFGATATDLSTGAVADLTTGPLFRALRASSAVPVMFHAIEVEGRWLVDGALSHPLPVSLARKLGADKVVAIDLNAFPRVLDRFNAPPPAPPAPRPKRTTLTRTDAPLSTRVVGFINETREKIDEQVALAKAKARAKPQLIETVYATIDIFQAQLSAARAEADPPDLHIKPDLKGAPYMSFDQADDIEQIGYEATMARRAELEALMVERG